METIVLEYKKVELRKQHVIDFLVEDSSTGGIFGFDTEEHKQDFIEREGLDKERNDIIERVSYVIWINDEFERDTELNDREEAILFAKNYLGI